MKRAAVLAAFLFGAASATVPNHVPNQCVPVYSAYGINDVKIKYCTVRHGIGPSQSNSYMYWLLDDCYSWADARAVCQQIHGGDLGVFPEVGDLAFLRSHYTNQFTMGPKTLCGALNVRDGGWNNFGVWVGLQQDSSTSSLWKWTDGTPVDDVGFPWNVYSTYYEDTNLVSAGTCGLAARTNFYSSDFYFMEGFYKASCAQTFKAVCMKDISSNSS